MASKFYILTLPADKYVFAPTNLPDGVAYLKGQLEMSNGTNLLHWQFILCLTARRRSSFVRTLFPGAHVEVTRSAAANEYVWKDDTAVPDTRFELGELPMRRNNKTDWDAVWDKAIAGKILEIPADVRVRSYSTLRRIEKDHMAPVSVERRCFVYWGRTGSGKSHQAWSQATLSAYPKDPNSKFWDGYAGQSNVVIDEFRGAISISHLLRWLDKYPCIVENKGGSVCLAASTIWITSNIPPKDWYPGLDEETQRALLRRMQVTHFEVPFGGVVNNL